MIKESIKMGLYFIHFEMETLTNSSKMTTIKYSFAMYRQTAWIAFFIPYNAALFLYKLWWPTDFFSIRNHHKCLSELFPLHLNTCVMGLRPL